MDVKIFVFLFCLVLGVMGRPKSRQPKTCSTEIISMRTQLKLSNQKIDGLDKKLDTILKVLEDMDQNVVHDSMCSQVMCSGYGNCSLGEDMDGYICVCEEGHTGEHCEVSGPCSMAWMEFSMSPPMPGLEEPRCDEEGFFIPVQFRGSQAICVDRNGEWLGFGVPRWLAKPNMLCDCALEGRSDCAQDGSYPMYDGDYDHMDSSDEREDYYGGIGFY
ncbi:uncharacterized protein LOC128236067 [Mya arenaria]|uniref:uncharacterized protein LOC128236067 n=1 Tax=Mya arenaria TaxID=6604 RepID=UPI0022E5EB8C|nr:uncharacterized protein LOC128236067 [Mya arenaria]